MMHSRDSAGMATVDIAAARRQIGALHSRLRDQGLNPLEALRSIADTLVSDGDEGGFRTETLPGLTPSTFTAVAFQEFISHDARSVFGQYLTPSVVAEHVKDLLTPGLGSGAVLDPFLGSGILLDAIASSDPTLKCYGWEINGSVAHVAHAALGLGGHEAKIEIGDVFEAWLAGQTPRVQTIATNPPFGAHASTVDRARLSTTLTAQSLGNVRKLPVELLALEACMDMLLPHGQLAIVLPQSVITNGRWSEFRRNFFSSHTLLHVTSLPQTTFTPFRGVAKACVLLIEKSPPAATPYDFSFANSKSIGYDDTGRPEGVSDLHALAKAYVHGTGARATFTPEFGLSTYSTKNVASDGGYRLGDIADVLRGKNPARDGYADEGPFLLKVGSLSGSFVSWRERKRTRVPQDWFEKSPTKHLQPNDICFTATAHRPNYIGLKIDLIRALPPEGALPSAEVIIVRLKPTAPFPAEALLYYLRSESGYEGIQSLVKGSTAHVYPRDLEDMYIPDLSRVFDVDTLVKLHREAEVAFRRYLNLEDEARAIAGLQEPTVIDDVK